MRLISVKNVKNGMVLGKTIFGSSKQNLLNEGTVLNEKYINRLQDLGITSIYIIDENIGKIDIDDIVCEELRLEAGQLTKEIINKIKLGKGIDSKKVKAIINMIIEDLLASKECLVKISEIRSVDDYLYFHSVNVAILAGITGISLGYNQNKLQELMIGALFHDIGKTLILEEAGSLKDFDESKPSEDLKKHTLLGYEILKQNKDLSILSAHVALQHHERFDGEGYPRNLAGADIHEYGRIVAIANCFDLMTSGRLNNPRIPFHQAVEFLMLNAGFEFDPHLVNLFIQNVALYPEGTIVRLNTREIAVIVKSYYLFPTRPRVKLLVDKTGQKLANPETVELYRNQNYFILEVLEDDGGGAV